jgi:single-stranded DNA-binding protein
MIDLLSGSYLKLVGQGRISRLGKHQQINGKRFFKFSVAYKLRKHVEYVNYVAYDKQADWVNEYAQVGSIVYVESVPHTNRYPDKDNPTKFKSKTLYQVENLSFVAGTKLEHRDKDLSIEQIKEMQDSVKDFNAINIAIKLLEQEGYSISNSTGNNNAK